MISDLSGVTAKLVAMAMDAAALRHQAIANNIANVQSEDYQPQHVSFEEKLALAINGLNISDNQALAERLSHIEPTLETDPQANGLTSVQSLDLEMVKLTKNVVHYQALLKGYEKGMAILKLAVSDGRR